MCSKYDSLRLRPRPVASMNPPLKFAAVAFSDYGGIGFEFYSAVRVVKPYFEGLREKEEEAGPRGFGLGCTQAEVGVPASAESQHHDSRG